MGEIMQDNEFYSTNANVSRFIVPFYLDAEFEQKNKILFNTKEWERITKRSLYLTKCIQEIYSDADDGVCVFYRLDRSQWAAFGLPVDQADPVQLESYIISGQAYYHICRLIDITAAYFSTGIGFLFLDVRHNDDVDFEEIVNTSFALSNIFSAEHDSKESKLNFYHSGGDTKISFSMKNAVYAILKAEQLKKELEIFPTSTRRKMCAYHRLFRLQREETDEQFINFLTRGLHSNATVQREKYDFFESEFQYSATENMVWSISSNGVISISYDDKANHYFLTRTYPRNVDVDYFLVYLFALHEREILLKYNYDAVRNWRNFRELTRMKDKLIIFNLLFTYNTVSVENSYQNFYECLYRSLKLQNLENDIQDVVAKVNEYVNVTRERKLNAILSSIAVLAVFSVLTDGISVVDRIYDPASFQIGHYAFFILVMAVICYGVIYFLGRKK